MKLYVEENKEKLYLEYLATTRQDLFEILGKESFLIKGKLYNINQVFAEPDSSINGTAAVVGGMVGTVVFPFFGTLLGVAAGIGSAQLKIALDYAKVKAFNNSKLLTVE